MKKLKSILIKVYGNICMRCLSTEKIVLEHIQSRYYGGTNDLSNLQLLCWDCNRLKGHRKWDFRPFIANFQSIENNILS